MTNGPMKEQITDFQDFKWIHSTLLQDEELNEIARDFEFPQLIIQDSMQAEHLPKMEKIDDITFYVFRFYDKTSSKDCGSIQELTRKLVLIIKGNEVLSIQRSDDPLIQHLTQLNFPKKVVSKKNFFVLKALKAVAYSFDVAIKEGVRDLESFEPLIFDAAPEVQMQLAQFYELKKRTSLLKRIMEMNHEVLQEMEASIEKDLKSYYQDTEELFDKQYFQLEELADNLVNLMNLHITLSSHKINELSHKNNEVMRVLTVFSVFFLPLNFIASIYGMNFEIIPELKWDYGYPVVLALMFSVALGLFLWFRSNGWLKK